jgi:NAD(P)H-dependent FMN reductase
MGAASRPTQGRTLAIMQMSGGSQSFNAVNTLRPLVVTATLHFILRPQAGWCCPSLARANDR